MDLNKKIQIYRSKNADSRSAAPNVTLEQLSTDTNRHIEAVSDVMDSIADDIRTRGGWHDHTKTGRIREFYEALTSGHIKETEWYRRHITDERHHLKSHVPDDVNLIDIIEHIVDCTTAGLTRSGTIYDIDLPPELLVKACANTVELLKSKIEVIDV
jgi:hypothetical protein